MKKVYQLHERLSDKLDLFGILYGDNQKIFHSMAIFDFESICVDDESSGIPKQQLGLENMFQFLYRYCPT